MWIHECLHLCKKCINAIDGLGNIRYLHWGCVWFVPLPAAVFESVNEYYINILTQHASCTI